jgi:TRAP-type transport system small permease protein
MTADGGGLRRSLDALATLTRWAVVILAATMLLSLSLQVFSRFVLNQALAWTEELALGCFSWSMLLAIALAVREASHVRMDTLADALPPAFSMPLARVIQLVIAAFGALLCWYGVQYVIDALGTTSAAIGYPIAWLYASAPACGLLIAIFALERTFWPKPLGLASTTPSATRA